ncbi:glycosyltransferase [Candidatus Parcubacteria bacterium]|nr:MAG: glycosyltransferase [Candidatus Parcubacteria bacterium]
MNVLMLVFNSPERGTYWRAFHFGRILVAHGHRVMLLTTARRAHLRKRAFTKDGVHVIEIPDLLFGPLRSGWDAWNTLMRLDVVRRQRFDVVHGFECRPVVIYPALLAHRMGARLVLDWADWLGKGGSVEVRPWWQRSLMRPIETFYETHFRVRADGHTVINHFLEERVRALAPDAPVRLLRNGSNLPIFRMPLATARRITGLPADGELIGFLGSTYAPDARLMAEAFNVLHRRRPQTRLLLAGYFNRPIETWLDAPEAVIRTGMVSTERLGQYLSACDVCWLPLTASGTNIGRWPYKFSDYLSAGCPIIASAVGDFKEILSTLGAGEVVPSDATAFAEHTAALLDAPKRRERLSAAALQAAETHFNWDVLGLQLEDFYTWICNQSSRSDLKSKGI